MRLDNLKPAAGSKKNAKRRGRGIASGLGKTGGRGHKGQKSRSGGFHKVGFEGGQMPLQRRIPKFGFNSHLARETQEIRLETLLKVTAEIIDIDAIRAAKLLNHNIKYVKVMLKGEVDKPLHLKGIRVSKGAKAAILAAGGTVEEA